MPLVASWVPGSLKIGANEIIVSDFGAFHLIQKEKNSWHVIALFSMKLQKDYSLNGGEH